MARDRRHKNLLAWQESMQLVTNIYALTAQYPSDERYGLVSQMRRAAVSVPSNIAEGAARASIREWLHFLYVAGGSLAELDAQLDIAAALGYSAGEEVLRKRVERCFGLIGGLLRSMQPEEV